jgi:hypothetical protein
MGIYVVFYERFQTFPYPASIWNDIFEYTQIVNVANIAKSLVFLIICVKTGVQATVCTCIREGLGSILSWVAG